MPDESSNVSVPLTNETYLPTYTCHKEVRAAKIVGISVDGVLTVEVDTELKPNFSVEPGKDWLDKHNPEVGGYYVVYEDGYVSYSPAQAFENGYQLKADEAA